MSLVKLGDICDFFNGGAWSQSEFTEAGYPVLKVSNCKVNGFEIDEISYIPCDIAQKSENNKLFIEDVIIATVGSHPNLVESAAGRSCIVTTEVAGFYLNQNAVCLRSKNQSVLNQKYLGYLAASEPFKHYIQSRGKGAANQMRIAIGAIKEYSFDLPTIDVQRKVGAVLAAYDDLIENNQKQIKLLEEAAQRLYKEWFVDLRFPGWETTPIVDGVPEGWKKVTINEMCDKTKNTISAENIPAGTPYIGLEHIPRHDFCLAEWGDAADITSSKAKYKRNDIIFGQIRPYFHKVGFAINDGVASTDSFIMTPHKGVWGLFLLTVFSDAFVTYSYQTCKEGAKMPRADWNQLKQYTVLIADMQRQALFEERIHHITERVRTLALQNRYLSEARDRLLPKLMSGELEM